MNCVKITQEDNGQAIAVAMKRSDKVIDEVAEAYAKESDSRPCQILTPAAQAQDDSKRRDFR